MGIQFFRLAVVAATLWVSPLCLASESAVVLDKAPVDLENKASLQRGAKYYMNYCANCHTMQYVRYKRIAEDLGIVDKFGAVDVDLMQATLVPTGQSINDYIVNAMPKVDATKWFGVAPPDLSLEARVRGADWLYTYLRAFYVDPTRPYGVNNLLFKDVGMPHVLMNEQGAYTLKASEETHSVESGIQSALVLSKKGTLSPEEYDRMVGDVVNFLVYTAEPGQLKRRHMGVWVMAFLVIFSLFAYLLKREFWKDIH